jgi:hypothetical protein
MSDVIASVEAAEDGRPVELPAEVVNFHWNGCAVAL